MASDQPPQLDIKPLLSRLWPIHPEVTATEIADAVSHFFTNQVSDVQAASLLLCLHFTGLDRQADVLANCAAKMREAAARIDVAGIRKIVENRGRKEGGYGGGLKLTNLLTSMLDMKCDIVGTGGDSHNTFNISTTSSILASSLLLMAKHGNRASTSKSGSADLLNSMQPQPPQIARVNPATIAEVYSRTNYAFLFAPVFHPGMRFVSPIRRQLPWRTIFNLLGPLSNPVDVEEPTLASASNGAVANPSRSLLEARVIGVARKDLGPVFADALHLAGSRKAMVVCGDEELDEISCAGSTLCWRISPDSDAVEHFLLHPSDFGLPAHPLHVVSPNKEPAENAAILHKILNDELDTDDPILHFVLMNTAALFVVSGICDVDVSDMGAGDDGAVIKERGPGGGRWKEGVRRARWAIKSGEAWKQWKAFVEVTNGLDA